MNNPRKHHLKIILGIGIPFGIIILLLQHFLELSQSETWRLYIFLAIVLLATAVLIDLTWQFRFIKKLRQINADFAADKDMDKFVRANEELLQSARSSYYRNLLQINLAASAARKNDYARAKELLLKANPAKLSGINKAVYYCNLIHFDFRLEENEEALSLLREHERLLQRWETSEHLQVYILIVRLLAHIAERRFDEAEKYLPELTELCSSEDLSEELTYIKKKLDNFKQTSSSPLQ